MTTDNTQDQVFEAESFGKKPPPFDPNGNQFAAKPPPFDPNGNELMVDEAVSENAAAPEGQP